MEYLYNCQARGSEKTINYNVCSEGAYQLLMVLSFRKFLIEFNNGTADLSPPGFFFCLVASSSFFGGRRFYGNAPFIFRGPG